MATKQQTTMPRRISGSRPPNSQELISLFWPSYNGREVQAEMAKLFPKDMSNRWLGQAHLVDKFEQEFGRKFSYKYPVSLSSGSAALELAYHLIGITSGDEVISPVLTCTATNIPLLRMGAKIVFADVRNDLTVSTEDIEKRITRKTKAIIAVTLGGIPVDRNVFRLAKRHKLPVVVDAAQSLGVSEIYGDYVCYSLQAIKNFTSGDGGLLVLRNKPEYQRAKKLRWFGIDREAKIRANWQPYKRRQMTMNIEEAGYKFQMNDIAAAIALVGLRHSDEYLARRREIGKFYDASIDRTRFTPISGGTYWLYGIYTENRDKVAKKMAEAGIETNMVHLRNDIFRVFGGKRRDMPAMNLLEERYLYLPINARMNMKDARRVVQTLNSIAA